MLHAVVFEPELADAGVDAFRARYDPFSAVVRDHVTLVFPLPDSVSPAALVRHVREVAGRWSPFGLHLVGLEESWDRWLLLGAQEGRDEMVRLHDELYAGMLAPYLRTDLPYAPHVGLGLFAGGSYDVLDPRVLPLDEERYHRARREAEALKLDFWRVVDRLTVLQLDEQIRRVRPIAVVPLGGGKPHSGAPQ